MDGTTATVVILIFVFSIISGVTNDKKSPISNQTTYDTETVYNTIEVESLPIHSNVTAASEEALADKLKGFIMKYRNNVSAGDAASIAENIVKYSAQYDVNPRLVTALIARESGFNKYAISTSNAQGLGQLLPSTAAGLGVTDPFDIEDNVRGTVRYMKSLFDRFPDPNKISYSIAGYFEGPNAVMRQDGFHAKSKSYVEDIIKIYNKIPQ